MKVAITLNEVVRDYYSAISDAHDNYLSSLTILSGATHVDISDSPSDPTSMNDVVLQQISPSTEVELLNLDSTEDHFNITKNYKFRDQEDFENFLYDQYAFSIYGRSGLVYKEAMEDLNSLYNLIVMDGRTVNIVSQERDVSKQGTFLYLSQNKFKCNKLNFLYNYTKIWETYDLVITANPYIINSKPDGKVCFKIKSPMNEHVKCKYEFDNLFEVKTFYNEKMKK